MSSKMRITFNPAGFAECLQGATELVREQAERIAAEAGGMLTGGGSFVVEVTNEPRFLDSSYGASRPVGHVMADEVASKEEAENKILSKAVSG